MKRPVRLLPCFTVCAGVLGLALRLWLFSDMDDRGLLPVGHFADSALYVLTALTFGVLFLVLRKQAPLRRTGRGRRLIHAAASVLAGCCLLVTALSSDAIGTVRLSQAASLASLLGAAVLLVLALLHLLGKKIPYLLYALLTLVLMVDTVAQCQLWGSAPQLQEYFFPLLASIFLILTAYQATACCAGQGKPRSLAFFSQAAVFLCFLSLNAPQWPFYLGMLFWSGAQFYSYQKEI